MKVPKIVKDFNEVEDKHHNLRRLVRDIIVNGVKPEVTIEEGVGATRAFWHWEGNELTIPLTCKKESEVLIVPNRAVEDHARITVKAKKHDLGHVIQHKVEVDGELLMTFSLEYAYRHHLTDFIIYAPTNDIGQNRRVSPVKDLLGDDVREDDILVFGVNRPDWIEGPPDYVEYDEDCRRDKEDEMGAWGISNYHSSFCPLNGPQNLIVGFVALPETGGIEIRNRILEKPDE